MQKVLKIVFISVFVVLGATSFFARGNSSKNVETASSETFAKIPKKIYLQNCARCHGADGKGETELGRNLDAPDLTRESVRKMSIGRISRIISKGDGEMPGFEKTLNKSEIKAVTGFVRTLK